MDSNGLEILATTASAISTAASMGQSDNMQWLKNYGSAFANGMNPMVGINAQIDKNTQAMYPPPKIATPPLPQGWSTQHGGPLFPMGPPSDFGGAILPNPDDIRPALDTQPPATRLDGASFYGDTYKSKKPPLRKVEQ